LFSLERQLTELPACALLAAALLAVERGRRRWAWLALAAASLNRETGTVVIAGFVLRAAWDRNWKDAGRWLLAAFPAAAWSAYVWMSLPAAGSENLRLTNGFTPLFSALWKPHNYHYAGLATPLLQFLDMLALMAALCTMVWGLLACLRSRNHLTAVALALALFGLLVSPADAYLDVFAYARYRSPLLLLQLLQASRSREPALLVPLAAMLPRALIPGASLTLRSLLHFSGWS
jgi:hypothetical protein